MKRNSAICIWADGAFLLQKSFIDSILTNFTNNLLDVTGSFMPGSVSNEWKGWCKMAYRRNCQFADRTHKNVNLEMYAETIIDTINEIVPGKNPEVFPDHFSTDALSHSEAVKLGQALVKIPELRPYCKMVTQFRLFEGKTVECKTEINNSGKSVTKGGHQ